MERRVCWVFALILCTLVTLSARLEGQSVIRVLAWSEGTEPEVVYPQGIDGAMAEILRSEDDMAVKTARLSDAGQGLPEAALANTDVLIWSGNRRHREVAGENVDRVIRHVRDRGMGFIALHSAHEARPFQQIMRIIAEQKGRPLAGTPGRWGKVRNESRPELIRVAAPSHPIADGIPEFTVPKTETFYGPFNVPPADVRIFEGSYEGGPEGGDDGLLWKFGRGHVFYFRPGHEGYPVYLQHEVRMVLVNAIRFLARGK